MGPKRLISAQVLHCLRLKGKRNAEDEFLAELSSDVLFNEFDCTYWSSLFAVIRRPTNFTGRAFPVLAKYHIGNELDRLVANHQWLAGMATPLKRQEAARTFHLDSIRNLTVLEIFTKLHFLKVWGSNLVRRSVFAPFVYEMAKIVESVRQSRGTISDSGADGEVDAVEQEAASLDTEMQNDDLGADMNTGENQIPERLKLSQGDNRKMDEEFGEEWRAFGSR